MSVVVSTSDVSAKSGVDYEGLTNFTATIPAGQLSLDVKVMILADGNVNLQGSKVFTASLSAVSADDVGTLKSSEVTIVEDTGNILVCLFN